FLNSRPFGQFGLVTQTLLMVGPFATLLGTGLRGLTWPPWREDHSTLFIAAAVILFAAGQFVTIDRIILGDSQPMPSTADLFRVAGYPLAVAAVLTLPTRRIPSVVRARIVLDGLM